LFAEDAKIFKYLRFRTTAERHIGAVTLWTLSFWPVTIAKSKREYKAIFHARPAMENLSNFFGSTPAPDIAAYV